MQLRRCDPPAPQLGAVPLLRHIGLATIKLCAGTDRLFKRQVLKRVQRVVVDEAGQGPLGGEKFGGPVQVGIKFGWEIGYAGHQPTIGLAVRGGPYNVVRNKGPRHAYNAAMELQSFHRFSRADLNNMLQTGILSPASALELIQGHLLNSTPGTDREQHTIDSIAAQLASQLGDDFVVQRGAPVVVDDYNVPRPSLSVATKNGEVLLAIQVAHGNLRLGRLEKPQALGRAGVPEYWLISLPERMLSVHKDPHEAGYKTLQRLPVGSLQVSPTLLPGVKLTVNSLFAAA